MAYPDTNMGSLSMLDPASILAQDPEATFYSVQDQFGGTPAQRKYYQGEFRNIFNQYLGGLSQQMRGAGPGTVPTGNFSDFMSDYDFSGRYAALPPSIRGATTSRFAPPARFLNF